MPCSQSRDGRAKPNREAGACRRERGKEQTTPSLGRRPWYSFQALQLRKGGDWEGVVEGRPQHGHESQPSSILGKVTSRKGSGNGIGLLAQMVELWKHGAGESLIDTHSLGSFHRFATLEGDRLA